MLEALNDKQTNGQEDNYHKTEPHGSSSHHTKTQNCLADEMRSLKLEIVRLQ